MRDLRHLARLTAIEHPFAFYALEDTLLALPKSHYTLQTSQIAAPSLLSEESAGITLRNLVRVSQQIPKFKTARIFWLGSGELLLNGVVYISQSVARFI